MITLGHYLAVSGVLFSIGLAGVIIRRNTIAIYMCLELMLTSGMIALVAFSRANGEMQGQVFVFFVITVAAAKVAVGLAILVALYRLKRSTGTDALQSMRF